MDGTQRRNAIVEQLKQAEIPLSATKLAAQFGVSRQIIVGDVALLRASSVKIIATSRGYKMEKNDQRRLTSQVVVQHSPEQTRLELETIVQHGGEIIDVIVEHEIYGELVGGLHIRTTQDIDEFMKLYQPEETLLLSTLTKGIHIHTIAYDTKETLVAIKAALKAVGILYQ